MQRMQREERGDCRAAPELVRRTPQNQKQEHRIERVQHDVDQQNLPRIEAEHLHVRHVGNPRQRQPIRRIELREGPFDVRPCQAGRDVIVLRQVFQIVDVGQAVRGDLTVDDKNGGHDSQRNENDSFLRSRFRRRDDAGLRLLFAPRAASLGHAAIMAASQP